MEDEAVKVVSISELIKRNRPLTGASSLTSGSPISPSKPKRPNQPSDEHSKSSFPANSTGPNPKILNPLNHPTIIVGTLTLPSGINTTASNHNCLQFSDGSATVCCDILNLDPRVTGEKIHVLAWNFIPIKSSSGFLEIIRWIPANTSPKCYSNANANVNSIPLVIGSLVKESSIARGHYVFGLLESVSAVSNVPCTFGGSGARNVSGFLAQILVCECKICSSIGSQMVFQHINVEDGCHYFEKSRVVYFYGSASFWHVVISRLVRRLVPLSGLKKKSVYIGKEESQLMYVTTERTLLHLLNSPTKCVPTRKANIGKMAASYMYSGIVTGIYMKGMVVELDRTVLLLFTDHQLSLPHSLRVGAIVSVKNTHLVYPTYSWTKVVILGSCFRTSIHVEAFSPMETGFQQLVPSHSLLGKFIGSLAFSARLWALLVVSSLRKKFAGILSDKVILGSKHTEGLAQKYSSSCLPLSVFRFRHGVFTEYFKHESCGCGNEPIYRLPNLVVPISNFIGYCESSLKKMQWLANSDIMGTNNQNNILPCGSMYYEQQIRRILKSEDLNVVLLGSLKVSQYSGRLQLVDATGSIDIVIPDLPSVWSINDIYEINDFSVIIEGLTEDMNDSESLLNESISCRSIFSNFQLVGQRKFEIYVYCHLRNDESRNRTLYPSPDRKENFKELENGIFHLLWVTHKLPVLQKFPGNQVVSDRSSVYVEAVILPWNLFLPKKDGVMSSTRSSGDHQMEPVLTYVNSTYKEHVAHKRCKTESESTGTLVSNFINAESDLCAHTNFRNGANNSSYGKQKCCNFSCPFEVPCSLTYTSRIGHCMASSGRLLRCSKSKMLVDSCCKIGARKVLMEFGADCFCKYELLRIGGFYMIKHHKEDVVCTTNESNDSTDGKVVINSTTHLWSISFSTTEVPLQIGQSCIFPYASNEGVPPENSHQLEVPILRFVNGCPKIYSDIILNMSADALSFLEADLRTSVGTFIKPSSSLEEVVNSSEYTGIEMTASLQSTGNFDSGIQLPVGNLISFIGHVLAVHKSKKGPLAAQVSDKSSSDAHRPEIFHGVTSSICIHVLVGPTTVKIFSCLSACAYPIGFGAGIKATFYRVLVLGQDAFMLTPASFIAINSITVVHPQYSADSSDKLATSAMKNDASLGTVPAALIFDVKHCLESKPMQFSCKVVALYVMVLEKNKEVLHSHSKNYSELPLLNIPLAGIVLDDGSSLCCCWANSENVATLLRLNEGSLHKASKKSLSSSKEGRIDRACNFPMGRMHTILKRHGRIAVKNYGSVLDSSCQDLTFSVASGFVSSSDEEFLKFTILNACFSTIWNVAGTILDSNALGGLEKRLAKLDMAMMPLPNIWVSEISHVNPITEARSILQELLDHD